MQLTLVFCFIAPLVALKVAQPTPQADKKKEFSDEVDQSHLSSEAMDRTESMLRKLSGPNKTAWIMFMGDSNMRRTYFWYTMQKLGGGKRQAMKEFRKKEFMWSDQDALVEYPDGFEVRASFRFLHGSMNEFAFKTQNWNNVSVAEMNMTKFDIDKPEFLKQLKADELNGPKEDPDVVQPSVYAKWAANNQRFVNIKKESPGLALKLEKYKEVKPSVVILTEGWWGIPECKSFGDTLGLFKKNPETKFVYSPVYVTHRTEKRHECYAQKMEEEKTKGLSLKVKDNRNYGFVDNFDLTKTLPPQNSEYQAPDKIKHIPAGGSYMRTAVDRFEDAIDKLI